MSTQEPKGFALVTGASSGIGATYADRLAKRGHNLILVARDAKRLEALATRLRAETGVKVEVAAADLTNKADVARLEDRLRTDTAIDLLVNNAGVANFTKVADSDPAKTAEMIQINVVAVTLLASAAAANFKAQGRGTIVNVGSVVGFIPEYGAVVYGATKAFVQYFTQALSLELAGTGVKLQAVLPGATRTEIWDRSGVGTDGLDPARVMEVGELVEAALAGLDKGELVTIPSLPDPADWDAFQTARQVLIPNASHNHPAPRFGVKAAVLV